MEKTLEDFAAHVGDELYKLLLHLAKGEITEATAVGDELHERVGQIRYAAES